MRIRALLAAAILLASCQPALAQSTATPVLPGHLTTLGCPSGYLSCFAQDYKYTHITTSTTTLVKTGTGYLHSICINTKGASANIATVDDALTATTPTMAIIDTTANVGCLVFDVNFVTGLTIVTATGTQADLTIAWR